MRALRTAGLALLAVPATLAGLLLGIGTAADPPAPLVVHEWGTFTSFSGSDGVPVGFAPNDTDLPEFVYSQSGPRDTKAARLTFDGTVSMETPVLYFYTDRPMKASVKVDFPRGWITEWFPFAAAAPAPTGKRTPGQSMRWDVRLLAGETVRFPGDARKREHYYDARETDAVPLQVEVPNKDDRRGAARGEVTLQREKFLFYRGVGSFPTPVSVKALSGGNVRVANALGVAVDGAVLVNVHGGKVGFKALGSLSPGADVTAALPNADGTPANVAKLMVTQLTAAGLYEKEAKAMVKTWDSAWFGEDGTRVLYLVPRSRTDELLPLTIDPKPTGVARVLVGRHDFLTPEQEADIDRQVKRIRSRQGDPKAAVAELRQQVGRFWMQAMNLAEKRLSTTSPR
jgi:hypothetical protein